MAMPPAEISLIAAFLVLLGLAGRPLQCILWAIRKLAELEMRK